MFNGLRRLKILLALHFRSPWYGVHFFSRNVGGSATPAAFKALADGRAFRVLTVVDQFSQQCPLLETTGR